MAETTNKTRWITRTALCTALVLLAQLIGKMLPAGFVIFGPFSTAQLVTGSLVNLVLILAASSVGLWAGVTCGVISSILASLLGMSPLPVLTPAIALGNAIIAAVAWYAFAKRGCPAARTVGVVVGAALKCAWLWVSVPMILNMMQGIPEKQVKMMSIMFSWPQFVTALVGGVLALAIYPTLNKALKK